MVHPHSERPRGRGGPLWLLCLLAQAAVAWSAGDVLPPPSDSGPGLLFHASFDADRRADFAAGADLPCMARYARQDRAAGNGIHVPGVFGQALAGVTSRGGSGDYDALGNFLAERGTIAMHVRQTGMHYGFEPLWVKTVDPYYWGMYTRLSNKGQNLSAWFPNEVYRPHVLHAGRRAKLTEGEWRHLAVAWDQAYGSRFYFDGKEVASNWGKVWWHSRGVDPDALALHYSKGVAYDEICIFDRPLTPEQIEALAKRNVMPKRAELAAARFDDAHRLNRLRELSWERADPGMIEARLGRMGLAANAVMQVIPLNARAVKKGCAQAFDGKLGNGWPMLYNYQYANGNGLHVELGEPYDYVTIEGYFRGNVYGERRLLEPYGTQPLVSFKPSMFMERWGLDTPRSTGWLSFFKAEMEDKGDLPDHELVTVSRVCDMSFFRAGAQDLTGCEPVRCYLGPAQVATGVDITGRFGQGDRAALQLSSSPQSGPRGQALSGLRYHHLLVPIARETPLRGIRLSMMLQGAIEGSAIRIEMRDPLLPGRRLLWVDFALKSARGNDPQPLDLTIDTADRVLPAGKPLWLTFCLKQDAAVLFGERSFVELLTGTKEQVLPEYLRNEMSFVRTRFSWLSEARPWGRHEEPEKEMIEFSRYARELFIPLTQLWKLSPDDPKVRSLWLWTHKHHVDTSPVEPLPADGCPNAPKWALLERELLAACRSVFYWWIENRQTPNGELGDAWGDDTDLIQNLPKLVLIGDPGGRLARCAKMVADGVYEAGLIECGINRRVTDTLHAYEDGVNAQPVMGLIDYGNPLYVERMMEAAKTVEEFLTAKDAAGRRRFRSGYFGAEGIRVKGKYGFDHPGNALFCHPALFLGYYSRNPRALRFLQEWIDGWLDYYAKAGDDKKRHWPKRTLMDGTVIGWDYKIRGYGYPDCYVALWRMTGEKRYHDVQHYWTGTAGAFMRGAHYTPALEMIDRSKWRTALIKWAEEADLSHPSNDSLGLAARERYMKWEVTGDETAAYEALEACVRKMRLTFDAHTWGEPINDRIWLPDHPLIMMMQGEMSDERNQLWPRHYVSYQGFSDFAAWVRDKSDTHLKVWLYSFADKAEDGRVRVWRTPLGKYAVAFGEDGDGDASPDRGEPRMATLHRSASIPLRLPPRQLCALEIKLVERSREDYWQRPDLAIGPQDVRWTDKGLSVTVHNLGNNPAGNVTVRVVDATGKTLGQKTIPRIDAPADLVPRRLPVAFDTVPRRDRVTICLDPDDAIPELNEGNNTAALPERP